MKAVGLHHVALTVNDWEKSYDFYTKLADSLGAEVFIDKKGNPHRDANKSVLIFVGDGFMFSIWEAIDSQKGNKFTEYNVGYHHMAFQAPSAETVDKLYKDLLEMGADIVDAPAEYEYVPGYYAVFFRDPDGMRLEYAYIPT